MSLPFLFLVFLPWNALLFLSRLYNFEYKRKHKLGAVESYLKTQSVPYKTETVTTSDGYHLEMQVLGSGPTPVFFLHGKLR